MVPVALKPEVSMIFRCLVCAAMGLPQLGLCGDVCRIIELARSLLSEVVANRRGNPAGRPAGPFGVCACYPKLDKDIQAGEKNADST